MKLTFLTLLILHINSLVDSGKYNDITIDDIHDAIEKKSLLQFIKKRCGKDIDLSLHLYEGINFESEYEERMNSLYYGYAGNESRKWGVRNQGLCLMLAWTNELIQMYASFPNEYPLEID
ncbi:hypothetical protein [Citrobacter youngae]|uniref:Uncharacterized protein n=1 Tax=Citrobacter youngae ATCC 29220 TaxID=500640 RepID=D4BB01_9ENTR|nr:hypothetical protein [Citrobacter youngae]EFE09362.1 hypothetical protein CIT292_07648 [Citrobacter youngae ATCC 29220]